MATVSSPFCMYSPIGRRPGTTQGLLSLSRFLGSHHQVQDLSLSNSNHSVKYSEGRKVLLVEILPLPVFTTGDALTVHSGRFLTVPVTKIDGS